MNKSFYYHCSKKLKNQIELMKYLLKHIGIIIAVTLVLIFLFQQYLKLRTHHGQKITLPDYIDMDLTEAQKKAKEQTFTIIPNDSIFVVGKPGGIILSQNPAAGSVVKEKRKIYVTMTKSNADQIKVERLPEMYGKDFDRKKRELDIAFEIKSEVVDYRFDAGPPNYILAVIYDQDTIISKAGRKLEYEIPKGGTLKFILSKETGGLLNVPNLRCMETDAARFMLSTLKLHLNIADDGQDALGVEQYITAQYPAYDPSATILMGDTIRVWTNTYKPVDCED